MLEWGLVIVYFILFCLLIKQLPFFQKSGLKSSFLWGMLGIKFIISLGLFYIYTHHYPNRLEADIFKYFDDSEIVYASVYDSPVNFFKLMTEYKVDNDYFFEHYLQHMNNWDRMYDTNVYNDSRTIIKFNAIFRFFSFGKFHVHSLFFCFLSLIGTVALFRVVRKFYHNGTSVLALLMFLLPSVLLWSSGVLKESILIFALGLLFLALDSILHYKKRGIPFLTILLTLILMVYIKFYVLVAFVPAIVCYILAHYSKWSKWKTYIPVLLLFGGIALVSKHIPPHMDFVKILEGKQEDFVRLAEFQDAGSKFELTDIDRSFLGIVKVIPEGVANCFIRPLPWRANSLLSIPAILENIFILGLLVLGIIQLLKKAVTIKEEHKNFLWFSVVFIFLLYAIIGVTTPVAGALVRYKVPALPFLMVVLIYLLQEFKLLVQLESKVKWLVED
jgi:hypothetical protein